MVALLIGIIGATAKSRRAGMPLLSGPGRKFVAGFAPSLIAGVAGKTYNAESISTSAGQTVSIEADFVLTSSSISSISVTASGAAVSGVTGQVYLYDYTAKNFVILAATNFNANQTSISGSGTGTISRFIGPGNAVRAILRGIIPPRLSNIPFILKANLIQVNA